MKKALSGFLAGILVTLMVWGLLREESISAQPKIAASLKGAQLSYGELRKISSTDLVPIENDEYALLLGKVEAWVQDTLIQKEMQAERRNR